MKKILLVLSILLVSGCNNLVDDEESTDKVIYLKDGETVEQNQSVADVINNTIDSSSDTEGRYVFGKKGLKFHNRKQEEVNKLFFAYPEYWHIDSDGINFSVYMNRVHHKRPLFIISMPEKDTSCSNPNKLKFRTLMTLGKEVLPVDPSILIHYIEKPGFVDKEIIDKICKIKEKNKNAFLCKNILDVINGKIKVIAINVSGLGMVLKIDSTADLYVCSDFIKESELFEKRSINNIAVFKFAAKKL